MMELGGAQQNTLHTVFHISPKDFQAFLLIGKGGELFEEAKTFKNTFIIPGLIREVRPIADLKAFFQIAKILKKIKHLEPKTLPIIVHTHSSKAGILGRWAAKFSGIPILIHSVHGFGFNSYQPFWIRRFFILLEQITSCITTKFITVSSANREKGIRMNIFPFEKTRLIRSGIDIEQYKNPPAPKDQMKKNLGGPDDGPVVTMISCLKLQKAPLDFVRACELVKKAVPNTRFVLVGDGTLRGAVETEVNKRNLQNSFQLLGWRRDIPEILHSTDVLTLTSLWEGLPRVLPQAMASGVPIVATRVDGSPEAVRQGVNGFLVKPADVHGLAEKIIFLLKNPSKAAEMGKRGFDLVGEFDIHKMVADQEKLYDELLRNIGSPFSE